MTIFMPYYINEIVKCSKTKTHLQDKNLSGFHNCYNFCYQPSLCVLLNLCFSNFRGFGCAKGVLTRKRLSRVITSYVLKQKENHNRTTALVRSVINNRYSRGFNRIQRTNPPLFLKWIKTEASFVCRYSRDALPSCLWNGVFFFSSVMTLYTEMH